MFVSPAYAQGAGAPGGGDFLVSFVPILLLIAIFWFLIFRPQQKRMKQHRAMLDSIKRGDTVVTSGGIVGKVIRAAEGDDLEVEIAQGTRVKVVRSMVSDVRSKTEPVNDNVTAEPVKQAAPKKTSAPKKSGSRSRSRAAKNKPVPVEEPVIEQEPVIEDVPVEDKPSGEEKGN